MKSLFTAAFVFALLFSANAFAVQPENAAAGHVSAVATSPPFDSAARSAHPSFENLEIRTQHSNNGNRPLINAYNKNREERDVDGIAADAFDLKFSPKSYTKTGENNYCMYSTTLMTDLRERSRNIMRGTAVDEDA